MATFAAVANTTQTFIAMHSIFWLLLVAPGFAAIRYTAANRSPVRSTQPPLPYSSYTYQ